MRMVFDCPQMFKKKTNIPPGPKPPTIDMLIEDLESAAGDNVIFNVRNKWASREFGVKEDIATSSTSDGTDPEVVFQHVKAFVAVNQDLQEMVHKLQCDIEMLQTSDLSMRTKAEEIRKQALNALK